MRAHIKFARFMRAQLFTHWLSLTQQQANEIIQKFKLIRALARAAFHFGKYKTQWRIYNQSALFTQRVG